MAPRLGGLANCVGCAHGFAADARRRRRHQRARRPPHQFMAARVASETLVAPMIVAQWPLDVLSATNGSTTLPAARCHSVATFLGVAVGLGKCWCVQSIMPERFSIDFAQPMPIFPLADCLLLPHATVPLHIFEQRYRTMTSDALDSRGLIAMAMFSGDEWQMNYEGRPAVRPIVCVGYVVKHQCLDDGRYNILLQGICRARIADEVDHEPYRLAMLEPTESPRAGCEDDECLAPVRAQIECLLDDTDMKSLACVQTVANWIDQEIPMAALVDLVGMATANDQEQRYQLLAQADLQSRAQWLLEHLTQTLRTLRIAHSFGPCTDEDGLHLN